MLECEQLLRNFFKKEEDDLMKKDLLPSGYKRSTGIGGLVHVLVLSLISAFEYSFSKTVINANLVYRLLVR